MILNDYTDWGSSLVERIRDKDDGGKSFPMTLFTNVNCGMLYLDSGCKKGHP
jgi:hypothetical protein